MNFYKKNKVMQKLNDNSLEPERIKKIVQTVFGGKSGCNKVSISISITVFKFFKNPLAVYI